MGTITEISYQRRNRSRVNVYVDGQFFGGMAAVVAAEHRLKPGVEIDESALKELMRQSDAEQATQMSIKLISRALKTEKELRDYLKNKGFDDEIISATVAKLKSYDYINDADYAAAYASTHSKSRGSIRISHELKLKGVKDEHIAGALAHCGDQEETAREIARKYIRSKPLDQKTKRNLANHLYSKGFDWEISAKIIKELFSSSEDEYD